jgi:hypothetical protein
MILIGFMIFFGLFPQVMLSLIKSSIVPFIQGM